MGKGYPCPLTSPPQLSSHTAGINQGSRAVEKVGELGEGEIGEEKPDQGQVDKVDGIGYPCNIGQPQNLRQEPRNARQQDDQ